MISSLGLLVQFSPAVGRVGCCRQMSLCMGSTRCVLARQPEVSVASPLVQRPFSPPRRAARWPEARAASPRARAPFPSVASGSGSQRFARALPRCGAPFPSAASGQGSQGLVRPLPRAQLAFSLRGPGACRQSGLGNSLDRNRGLFAVW